MVNKRLAAFGNHFKTAHGDCFLNDFHDGTFGIVGFHNGKEQPLVISQEKRAIASVANEAGTKMLDNEPSVAATVDLAEQPKPGQPNGDQYGNRSTRPIRRDKALSEGDHFEDTPLGRPYERYSCELLYTRYHI